MSATAIIAIILVASMMLGPLMLMQPSRRQKYIAGVRQQALKKGLKVQLLSFKGGAAVYTKAWPSNSEKKWTGGEYTLEKKAYPHDIHFCGYWDWEGDSRAPEGAFECIRDALNKCPSGITELKVNKLGVGYCWDEVGGVPSLDIIDQALSRLVDNLWQITP